MEDLGRIPSPRDWTLLVLPNRNCTCALFGDYKASHEFGLVHQVECFCPFLPVSFSATMRPVLKNLHGGKTPHSIYCTYGFQDTL
eukprot:scaffold535_cov65-Cylindrotheca_fusiformis.AAC.11